MYPSQHAALTALACLPLKLRGWSLPELAAFAAGATLIDVDHYLAYAIALRDYSIEVFEDRPVIPKELPEPLKPDKRA